MPAVEIGPGTRVLVTGASRGIGNAIARAFAARGCTLGLVARRSGPLEELAGELPGSGHAVLAGDVADPDSISAAIEQFGDVDVLVANAGITHYRPFAQLPLDEARQMNDVNWLGTIYTVWSALPCQTDRMGQSAEWLDAERTRSGSASKGGWPCPRIRSKASGTERATPNGSPAITAPPANTSGYAASITAAMAPPAERPVTNTR